MHAVPIRIPFPEKAGMSEKYGRNAFVAVEVCWPQSETCIIRISASFRFVDLAYEENITREKIIPISKGGPSVQSRWAQRMLKLMDDGAVFPEAYTYPVQAWKIGKELLIIGIGGESVVDYSLRFKKDFGPDTWVCGYANDMAAYIPSRRVWEEGGYEGGPHLDEYGRPAWRWAGDIEDRIAGTVQQVVKDVRGQ